MKFYNLIFLLSLSALFALNNAQESPKNSTVVDNQINAGYILISKITEFYRKSFIGTVFDGFIAKKDIFVYFKERMIHRSVLILNITDVDDYRTFSTDISKVLDSAIDSINYDINDLYETYTSFLTESNLKFKNNVIDATASLRNIIDTNSTAFDCYMKYFRTMIPNKFNAISSNQKNVYKSSIAKKIDATSEFVQVVERFIISIEDKLDYCIGRSLNFVKCLNNYATHTGQSHIRIVQAYQPDFMKNATSLLAEADDEYSMKEESMLEVILTVEAKTKECAQIDQL